LRGEKSVKNTTCRDLLTDEGCVYEAMKQGQDTEKGSIPRTHPSFDKSGSAFLSSHFPSQEGTVRPPFKNTHNNSCRT